MGGVPEEAEAAAGPAEDEMSEDGSVDLEGESEDELEEELEEEGEGEGEAIEGEDEAMDVDGAEPADNGAAKPIAVSS